MGANKVKWLCQCCYQKTIFTHFYKTNPCISYHFLFSWYQFLLGIYVLLSLPQILQCTPIYITSSLPRNPGHSLAKMPVEMRLNCVNSRNASGILSRYIIQALALFIKWLQLWNSRPAIISKLVSVWDTCPPSVCNRLLILHCPHTTLWCYSTYQLLVYTSRIDYCAMMELIQSITLQRYNIVHHTTADILQGLVSVIDRHCKQQYLHPIVWLRPRYAMYGQGNV